MNEIFARIEELRQKEIRTWGTLTTQAALGMHRRCELDLLGMIARDIKAAQYIELGCGAGYGLNAVKTLRPDCVADGFESTAVLPINQGFSIHRMDVFSPEFLERVSHLVDTKPLFVYTDNGDKRKELQIMSSFIHEGDIIGTHDWPNEVVDEKFMLDMGFVVCDEYEEYIRDCLSLQRFWRRA